MDVARRTIVPLLVLIAGACRRSDGGNAPGPADEPPAGGSMVSVTVPASASAELDATRQALAEVQSLDADGFAARYAVHYGPALGYDPTTAVGLDRINGSLALSAAELDALKQRGFVIAGGQTFPAFSYGYASIYASHLPLFVSADSILDAVHRSYDEILKLVETGSLLPELVTLLGSLRTSLATNTALKGTVRSDLDFYLAVALGLLTAQKPAPVAGGNAAQISSFIDAAVAASGAQSMTIFGVSRDIDMSQFSPRSHYTETEDLKRYFRAMIWLGRIDFRLIETQSDGSQLFYRRQFDAMLGLHSLFDEANAARQADIDGVIQAFAGESDNLTLDQVGRLLADLGAPPRASSVGAGDDRVAQAILDGGYGAQRIASDLMVNAVPNGGMLPLHRTFLLFGQRYTLDSHVFSNVVYDRVPALRMLPSPLDAAFAALHNDQAGAMLDGELRKFAYAPKLAQMRILADDHGDAFWGENLYNLWLSSLRSLSPSGAPVDPAAAGMPGVTGTEAWQRRLLNTELASWAELRHDSILYVKPSYTLGPSCEFPDAYVEPYPDFFAALQKFAEYAGAHVVPVVARSSADAATQVGNYFTHLDNVSGMLRQMAESERTGTPFDTAQMAFINEAVTLNGICGAPVADGWYAKLIFGDPVQQFKPTIADVHTQYTDEGGNVVGRVLHVGTGYPRLMVMTREACSGPRAYAGLVSSYYEKVTENFDRLTDDQWLLEFDHASPPDVPWVTDLLGR